MTEPKQNVKSSDFYRISTIAYEFGIEDERFEDCRIVVYNQSSPGKAAVLMRRFVEFIQSEQP